MITSNIGILKGYDLLERLGEGAFGTVYRAYQPHVSRDVAIKIIHPHYANHPDFIRRFDVEAHLVAQLEHLHIVPLYDYWREPDGAYLVMRLMKGGSLDDSLRRSGPWEPTKVVRLVDQIASALDLAHKQGIVHRDLKPANILLDEQGNAYLSDFGIAKELKSEASITQTGAILGTPAYLTPEQVKSDLITPQTDIYSLGVVIYEMLVGDHPFADTPTNELFTKHLNEPLPAIHVTHPDLPLEVDEVIQRATAKEPAKRYADAIELAADLSQALRLEVARVALPEGEIYNPYKGLHAFQEADADDFFGREALTKQLLSRLGEKRGMSRFLAVIGPSGSGKSSVVKAGLLPALRKGALPGSDQWFIVEMVPGTHPLEELELALLRIAVDSGVNLAEQLKRDERGLLRASRLALPGEDSELLLVIDQFEELFTLVEDEAQVAFFMESLYAAVVDTNSPLRVVITLRADFYDQPLMHPDFGRLLEQRTAVVLPLTADELDRAISSPAEYAGVVLETGLSLVIMAEVSEQPGALPLLQYALTELFERRQGRILTSSAYKSIGGVLGALGRRAEEIHAGLEETEKLASRQLFLRLITLGEGEEDTRRRVLLREIKTLHATALPVVLDKFGEARLLTFDNDPLTRGPTVEVAHEALLYKWRRLREWLDVSRADLRLQRLLGNAASEWLEAGKDDSYLLRGSRLDQLEAWRDSTELALTQGEQDYLEASLKERVERRTAEAEQRAHEAALERRSRNFLRALTGVLAVAAIVAAILSALAINQRSIAINQRSLAVNSATTATYSQGQAQIEAATAVAAQEEAQILAAAEAEARQEAERSRRLSNSNELVAFAQAELEIPSDVSHSLALLLAREAVLTTLGADGYVTGGAEASLRQAIDGAPIQQITFSGHTGAVNQASWSPDGRYVTTVGDDSTARVWDAESGEKVNVLSGHSGIIRDARWSPDGRRILTASNDFTARTWDVETGEQKLLIFNHERYVNSATWSQDGKRIVTVSDVFISVWDGMTGDELLEYQIGDPVQPGREPFASNFALFSPDGKWIATRYGNSVFIIDSETGEEILQIGRLESPSSAQWSQDGSRLLTAHLLGIASIWDTQTGELLGEFRHTEGEDVIDAAWSPDEGQVATVTEFGVLSIRDSRIGTILHQWQANFNNFNSVEWSPDGERVLTSGQDGVARIWKVGSSGRQTQFVNPAPTNSARWSPDGTRVLTAGGVLANLWDVESRVELGEFGAFTVVHAAAWHPAGERILTGHDDGTAIIWDAQNGEQVLKIPAHEGAILSVEWDSDGGQLITSGRRGPPRIWDAQSGEQIHSLRGQGGVVTSASWSPDDQLVITTSMDGNARIWDAETGNELVLFQGHTDRVNDATWSPDGRQVATASSEQSIRIWDVESGGELSVLSGHTGAVLSVNWDPSGERIVSASDDRTAIIWDARSGEQIGKVRGHEGAVVEARWSPDGTQILTASSDRTARIWPVGIEGLLRQAEVLILRDPPEFTSEERCIYLHECGE